MSKQPVQQGTPRQVLLDQFYFAHGPCCAGCDWWRHLNVLVGECHLGAPAPERDRWGMTGVDWTSLATGAGHVVTKRDHYCGAFRDGFDWSSLPPAYQRQVGVPGAPRRA